jgi:predicted phosphohydrolase
MTFAFDLISDLHVETWEDQFDWSGQATSLFCVVAGDIAKDKYKVVQVLKNLGKCYQAVLYIDGNDEHSDYLDDLDYSYADLIDQIHGIPNVVYLQDNVAVINGVAILGTNGWWDFEFDHSIDSADSKAWYREKFGLDSAATSKIERMSKTDGVYLNSSIKRLQTHKDVKKIVIVSHTVPDPALLSHDIRLEGNPALNTMGNRRMLQALTHDTEHKIHTWCFGHYHNSIDQVRRGVRFVNNCRGRADTDFCQHVYHPKRIVIDF